MNRPFLSLAAGIIALGALLVFQATRSNASTVLTVSELLARAGGGNLKRIRIGARVGDEDILYQLRPKSLLEFTAHDRDAREKAIAVRFEGMKPDLFRSGRDVLIDGDYVGGVLIANQLLTQCPSKYEPSAPGKD